jgi:hypothetical protein
METTTNPNPEVVIARWVEALNARGAEAEVLRAVEPGLVVERLGLGAYAGVVVERIEGPASCARWMALSPPDTEFSIDGAPAMTAGDGGETWTVGYRISVAGFRNGGRWHFRVGDSGRIAWIRHDPRQLAEEEVAEVRDPAETWRRYMVPVPEMAHHHDHGDGAHPDPTDPHDH